MSTQQQTSQGRAVRTVRVRGGKEYVEVAERVRLAHEEGGYTELEPQVFNIGERWFYRAGIVVDGQTFYGTAEIKFGAKPGTADGDAPIECAETSAVGRAFAFAGIGILDGIASADEVRRTGSGAQQPATAPAAVEPPVDESQRDPSGPASPAILNRIAKACHTLGVAVPTDIKSQIDAERRLEALIQQYQQQQQQASTKAAS